MKRLISAMLGLVALSAIAAAGCSANPDGLHPSRSPNAQPTRETANVTASLPAVPAAKAYGVASAHVGGLVHNEWGSQLNWVKGGYGSLGGETCKTGGSVAPSGTEEVLKSKGVGDCAEWHSITTDYTKGIFQAEVIQNGGWGAYWMSGPSWPKNGEVDAMESCTTTYHSPAGSSGTDNIKGCYDGKTNSTWYWVTIVRASKSSVTVYVSNSAGKLLYSRAYTSGADNTGVDPETVIFDVTDGGGLKVARLEMWSYK